MKSRSDILKDLSVHTARINALATTVKSNAEKIKVVSDKYDSMSASLGSGFGTSRSALENVCTDGSNVRTTPQRTIEVPWTSGTRSVVSQTPSLTDDRRNTDTEAVDPLGSSDILKPPKFSRCYKLGETSQWTFFIDKFISKLVTRGCRAIDKQLNLLCPVSESVEHVIRDTLIQHIDECYYVQMQHLDKPMDMLLRLRKLKAAEVLKDAETIKREIFSHRYDRRKDTPLKFIEKFDTLIREYNQAAQSGRLPDQEIAGAFCATVKRCCTGLQTLQYVTMVDQEKRGEQKTGMLLDELKRNFLDDEALRQPPARDSQPKAAMATANVFCENKPGNNHCYNCKDYRTDHVSTDCSWKGKGLARCFNCNYMTNHQARNCPGSATVAQMIRPANKRRGAQQFYGNRTSPNKRQQQQEQCNNKWFQNNQKGSGQARGNRGNQDNRGRGGRGGRGGNHPPPSKISRKTTSNNNNRRCNNTSRRTMRQWVNKDRYKRPSGSY
ncbi:hypothetical protein QAD02_020850 [Eretmocerus hayati]|uniref:Uncharacterized protein n=1 Tax=Eretmocerus hayati TaxID=131215 RepID=A0ACC2PNS4_9HYME|nr:hypothetical protein QAD02_020850 [Eretmocerus hayati]